MIAVEENFEVISLLKMTCKCDYGKSKSQRYSSKQNKQIKGECEDTRRNTKSANSALEGLHPEF